MESRARIAGHELQENHDGGPEVLYDRAPMRA